MTGTQITQIIVEIIVVVPFFFLGYFSHDIAQLARNLYYRTKRRWWSTITGEEDDNGHA
jgi:hypothetical protein